MKENINSKIILVTGASRGIGRAIAEELAKENIVIANYNKSEEAAKRLQEQNENIDIFKADVSNRAEVKKMIDYIIDKYGKIDVLMNNAGFGIFGPFEETPLEKAKKQGENA